MRKVKIKNYRCLEDVEVAFSDITTLIGPNGAGKSSVLRALDWFFNGGKAVNLTEDDIHVGGEPRCITVEVEFGELSPDDRAALGVLGSTSGDSVVVGRSWEGGTGRCWAWARAYPLFEHLRSTTGAMEKRDRYRDLRADHPELDLPPARSVAEVDRGLLEWEARHPDALEDQRLECAALFGFAGHAKMSGLFDYVFVSADLRADEEARDVKSSVIGRILEQAIDRRDADEELPLLGVQMADQHTAIQTRYFTEQLTDLSERLTVAVGELTRGRKITVQPVLPEFKPPPIEFTMKVADGPADTRVDQQGHGFRRALLISALRLLADSTAASGNRVICLAIEEPELFQHPVQARTFAMVLRTLAKDKQPGVQVTYATHSPFFLEAEGFPEIRRVTRDVDAATGASRVVVRSTTQQVVERRLRGTSSPEQVSRQLSGVFLNRLPESLFASAVIVVEGTTDRAILEGYALRDDPLNACGIVVVDAGGKQGIPLAHTILEELGVPCFVLFDGDAGAGGRVQAKGNSRVQAKASVAQDNRRLLRYLSTGAEDHPATRVRDRFAVLGDTLETLLEAEWPEWEKAREILIREGRGVDGMHAATYQLAAIEAATGPPTVLTTVVERAKALSPDR